MYILSAKQMKLLDAYAINKYKVPDILLMEHAALESFKEIEKNFDKNARIIIACGPGNNGGDGLSLARILIKEGYSPFVLAASKQSEIAKTYYEILELELHNIYHFDNKEDMTALISMDWDLVVDAVFGISLDRDIEGVYGDLIKSIRLWADRGAFVYSLDIPSGVDASTGAIKGVCVKADKTISFAYGKIGLYLFPAAEYSGEIVIADIGIGKNVLIELISSDENFENVLEIIDEENTVSIKRRANTHKGSYGTLLLIAGSKDMAGAAILSAKAAYRAGLGMVRLLTHKENKTAVNTTVPEVICHTYEDELISESHFESLISGTDAILIGCGLSKSEQAKNLINLCLKSDKKLLIDADGLNIISENSEYLEYLKYREASTILTPHILEMSRLSGLSRQEILSEQIKVARNFALEYGANLALKSARTVVADESGKCFLNIRGNNGMASAGSGDVLAGMLGGYLATMSYDDSLVTRLAVYMHALAGDRAAKKRGKAALMASDIIEEMGDICD